MATFNNNNNDDDNNNNNNNVRGFWKATEKAL